MTSNTELRSVARSCVCVSGGGGEGGGGFQTFPTFH